MEFCYLQREFDYEIVNVLSIDSGYMASEDIQLKRNISPPSAACFWWLLAWLTLLPCRWWRYVPPKHLTLSELQGITTQKTVRFTVTALRTSNPTKIFSCMKFLWNMRMLKFDKLTKTLRSASDIVLRAINPFSIRIQVPK
jgi:hypothetical protein